MSLHLPNSFEILEARLCPATMKTTMAMADIDDDDDDDYGDDDDGE